MLGTVRVTVDRERDTLAAALALLFTGLSIVLSVGLSSIQNVANGFSLRLMSVILRGPETRLVVSVFVVALAFVVTAQVRLRSADSDAPASPLTLLVGFVVVVPGDLDRDEDVDQEDFGYFQTCLTGDGFLPAMALAGFNG